MSIKHVQISKSHEGRLLSRQNMLIRSAIEMKVGGVGSALDH